MNKKQYIAPSATVVKVELESALLETSVDGLRRDLTEEEGDEFYSKGAWQSENWSDREW